MTTRSIRRRFELPGTDSQVHLTGRELLTTGVIAAVTAVAINLVIWIVAEALFDIDPDFEPMNAGPIAFFSTMGSLGAVAVLGIVQRFSSRPFRTYLLIAVVVLFLSFIPDISLLVGDAPNENLEGANGSAIGTLLLMHVVVAGTVTLLLANRIMHHQE